MCKKFGHATCFRLLGYFANMCLRLSYFLKTQSFMKEITGYSVKVTFLNQRLLCKSYLSESKTTLKKLPFWMLVFQTIISKSYQYNVIYNYFCKENNARSTISYYLPTRICVIQWCFWVILNMNPNHHCRGHIVPTFFARSNSHCRVWQCRLTDALQLCKHALLMPRTLSCFIVNGFLFLDDLCYFYLWAHMAHRR